MIGAPIPQDVLKFESKLIGNFTAREAVIYGAGIIVAATVVFKAIPSYIDVNTKLIVGTLIMLVFFAWGHAKPFGQPLEKVIFPIIEDNLLKPSVRIKAYDRTEHEKAFNAGLKSKDSKDKAKRSKDIAYY